MIFVCTGNICRSPWRRPCSGTSRNGRVSVPGSSPQRGHRGLASRERADHRTIDALARRGYDGSLHRARQFTAASFAENDLVVALDRTHERILREWARDEDEDGKVTLLLAFDPDASTHDVPDPYYAGPEMFDSVLGMIETATRGLFRQLEPALRLPRTPRTFGA